MIRVVIDIEANGLENPTQVWVIVCKNLDTGEYYVFREVTKNAKELERFLEFARMEITWIGHNILGYDLPVLQRLCGLNWDVDLTYDTLVLSKLIDYSREGGHSIEAYGQEFSLEKIHFNEFTKYSYEMEKYCRRDVDICEKIYKKYTRYINLPRHQQAIRLEHSFQLVVNELHANGFYFNKNKATELLKDVTNQLDILDTEIQKAFPTKLKLVREVHPTYTKHGTLHRKDFRFELSGDLSEYNGGPFCKCVWEQFNPSSHKQLVDVLHGAGWQPTDKTKTHVELERELNLLRIKHELDKETELEYNNRLLHLRKYGWKINEQNLSSLPRKENCLIKLQNVEKNTLESIIKDLKLVRPKELTHVKNIIPINVLQNQNNSKEITELLSKILNALSKSKMDHALFVAKEKHLWSIIVTQQDVFVDCSASFVTDTSDGLNVIKPELMSIWEDLSFDEAPAPARTLAQRILLEARRRTLTEWLNLVKDDSRIHGNFQGLGAWTHRMAHQNPNTANIPTEVKLYGHEMRALWGVDDDHLLVGVDAEGIQLRIFAHYINDPEFTNALVAGKKEDKSDPHSLNQRILGAVCGSRQIAKRFIYALLLGAGLGKIAEILSCSKRQAEEALERVLERYTGFAELKSTRIPQDARRGWFIGLDGRSVRIPGSDVGGRRHLCMSGYLQAGEAVVMKMATLLWMKELREQGIWFKIVNFVHDEWQIEVENNLETAIRVAKIVADSLRKVGELINLNCPLAGSYWNDDLKAYTIGKNWAVTH